jgi:hypothetical protein
LENAYLLSTKRTEELVARAVNHAEAVAEKMRERSRLRRLIKGP